MITPKTTTAQAVKEAAPAPRGQELTRIVHSPAGGVRRSRFVLGESYKRVAATIDEMNHESSPVAQAQSSATPGITRDQVLIAMAGMPDGGTAVAICEAILGRNDERAVHRISAHLSREVDRGLVEPNKGRMAKRRLTPRGRVIAAQMEIAAAQAREQAAATAKSASRSAHRPVNGVFDYARKMQLSVGAK